MLDHPKCEKCGVQLTSRDWYSAQLITWEEAERNLDLKAIEMVKKQNPNNYQHESGYWCLKCDHKMPELQG